VEAGLKTLKKNQTQPSPQIRENWEGLLYLCKTFYSLQKESIERLKIFTNHQYVCCFNLVF
jgi:hypothetical protein